MDGAAADSKIRQQTTTPAPDTDDLVQTLYVRHSAAVLARANKILRDRQQAEDVTQETLLRAWLNVDRIPPDDGSLRRWLLRVAHNLAIDRIRARKCRPAEIAESACWDACVADHSDRVVDAVHMAGVLRRLSPDHRAVLIEVYLNGRTVAEAARVLYIPVGTVKSRIFYALRVLRAHLAVQQAQARRYG